MRLKKITFLRQVTSLRRTDKPEITFKPLTCFHYLSKHVSAQRKKQQGTWGKRVDPAPLDPSAPSGACPVCGSGGRCAELEAEVMGGAVGGQRRLLRSPRWTRLEPGLSSSRCSLSETSRRLLTSPRRSEESREQRAAQSTDLSVSRKAGERSLTSLYEYVRKNDIYAVNLKKKNQRMGRVAFQPFDLHPTQYKQLTH